MSRFLRALGGFIAIAGGLLGFALSLLVVYSEFGGTGGVFLGLFLFPFTFTVIPFYTLLVYGSWTLLFINYGSMVIVWFLVWIADEIEQRLEDGEAAKGETFASPILLLLGALIFVAVLSAFANPDLVPTLKGVPGPAIARTKTQPLRSAPTQRPPSIHACVTDSRINIRKGPSTHSEIIGGMVPGICMLILGRNPDSSWVYIVTADNQNGWVAAWLLAIEGDVTRVSLTSDSDGIGPASTATSNQFMPLCFEIANRLGEYVSCKIKRAECIYHFDVHGNSTSCTDRSYPNQGFQLAVLGEDWSNYDSSCIVVSGYLETYRGVLQIEGFSRSQVSYCE